MRQYFMEVLLRPADNHGEAFPRKAKVTANSQTHARRTVIHQAAKTHKLVSRFLSVESRSLNS